MTTITTSMPGYTTSPIRGSATFNSDVQTRMNEMDDNATALNTIAGQINTVSGEINAYAISAASSASEADGYKDTANGCAQDAAASAQDAANYASALTSTSNMSLSVSNGSKTITTQPDKQYESGMFVVVSRSSDSSIYMYGQVTNYSGTTLELNISSFSGSGSYTDWNISVSGIRGPVGASTSFELVDDPSPQLGAPLETAQQMVKFSKGIDVASANALSLGSDGNFFDITGTTTITSINTTGAIGSVVKLKFNGELDITHHATNLILPDGLSLRTYDGLVCEFTEYAAGKFILTGTNETQNKKFLYAVIADSASAIVFEDDITDAYSRYVIESDDCSGAGTIFVQFGTGTTPTYQTSDYDYFQKIENTELTTRLVNVSATTASGVIGSFGYNAPDTNLLRLEVSNPGNASERTVYESTTLYTTSIMAQKYTCFGKWDGIDAVTAIKLFSSSGFSGTFKLYGIK